MTNEKRNAAITAKIERYTQHHTATPNLAQEAIERIAMTNDKDSAVLPTDEQLKAAATQMRLVLDDGYDDETAWASGLEAAALRQPTQSDALREVFSDLRKTTNALIAQINALENPTPELVEAVARKLCDANGCVWDLDPISDARIQWYNDAATALTAAAAYLFAENAKESTEQIAQNANCPNLKGQI